MAFTYDLASSDAAIKTRSQLRLLIPDRVAAEAFFQDDELDTFLVIESSSLKRATALALETIASDEALVQKVIKTLHLETDGAKTADSLLKRAKLLREQAAQEAAAAVEDDGTGYFDIAELVLDPFSARERMWNEGLRYG